jgi:Prokaryotic E2 family C/ThiF family
MALAPFFDKAALAAAEILRNYDRHAFEAALDNAVVGLAFDGVAASRPDARHALDLTANLLSRLYPTLALVPLDSQAAEHRVALERAIRSINPDIDLLDTLGVARVCVVIGDTSVQQSVPVVYLGADGWVARISMRRPLGTAGGVNPFGAGAAACLAVALVFRVVFGSQLHPEPGNDEDVSVSVLDLHPGSAKALNPLWAGADLGESVLVGLGAIGNGATWALARAPDVRGILHLVDSETIDATNPQRYVLATLADVRKAKVRLAAEHLTRISVDVRTHAQTWGQFLTERGDWLLPRVAVAVDSAAARQAIQAALPRWVVNAWTQPGDLGLSRHDFVGDQACLMCLYLPDRPRPHLSQLVAEAIGFPFGLRRCSGANGA